jgi:hypothetical protein
MAQSIETSAPLLMAHLRHNVVSGNEDHLQWLLKWFAASVQRHPARPPVPVVLKGPHQEDKEVVAKVMGDVLGTGFARVTSAQEVSDPLSFRMASLQLLYADRVPWDRETGQRFETLINRPEHLIKERGQRVRVKNSIYLLVNEDPEHPIPAPFFKNELAIFRVGNSHRG